MEKLQADINIRPNELEALKGAEVIRLTDGQEFVRKDVASKIMANYAQQEVSAYQKELASLKEVVKELIPIAEQLTVTMESLLQLYLPSEKVNQDIAVVKIASYKAVIDRAKTLSDNS